MDYHLVIGADDPRALQADTDADAVTRAVSLIRTERLADLRDRPQAVVTLMGPSGLLTRPSERLDAFVERILPANPAADPDRLQPGDSDAPDCNSD